MDRKFQEDSATEYTYHLERVILDNKAIEELCDSGEPQVLAMIQQKELDHSSMLEIGKSDESIMEYLSKAPNGTTYDIFLNLLK